MTVLFTNNATTRLASALTSSATTMTVTTGDGAKYPSPATNVEWFPVTIINSAGVLEIVRCTSRAGDVLTIRRAQEGTTAQAFSSGDRVELRLTAAALIEFQQGGQLFMPFWWPNRAAIPAGLVAADGQTLSRATYPDAAAGVLAGNVPTVADATWLSTPTQRGRYTVGDGSTTFRLPDYNGKYAGSLGALFLRGDGALSAGTDGDIQLDAFQYHSVQFNGGRIAGAAGSNYQGLAAAPDTGGIEAVTGPTGFRLGVSTLATAPGYGNIRIDVETRPLNVTGCWVIKLFGAVINPGSVNAAQLATDLANLVTRMNTLEQIDKGYMSGLKVEWLSLTSVRVTPGSAVIPSTGTTLQVPSALTITPPAGVSGFAHIYLYNNAGTPAIEMVTTAPVAYFGDACQKTGDATRRYVCSLLMSSGAVYNFVHYPEQSRMAYAYASPGVAPFSLLAGGTATTPTVITPSGVCPITATHLCGLFSCAGGGGAIFWSNEDMANALDQATGKWLDSTIPGGYMHMDFPLSLSTNPRRMQYQAASPSSGFIAVTGYLFRR